MKPILFNTEMVKAILEGRKTVTRRIADINTEITCNDGTANHDFVLDNFAGGTLTGFVCRKCGFGVAPPHSRIPCGTSFFRPSYWPGDILYVRETWQKHRIRKPRKAVPADFKEIQYSYRADGEIANSDGTPFTWRPSIHMPKEAARLFLLVKNVRVERLNDMQEEDAIAEGFPDLGVDADSPLERFSTLWDKTIRRDQIGELDWYANPWVWVIEFERCEKPKEEDCEGNN